MGPAIGRQTVVWNVWRGVLSMRGARALSVAVIVSGSMLFVLGLGCEAGAGTPQAPVLSVDPGSLDFGTADSQRSFAIANSGGGTLTWSVSAAQGWIGVSPEAGSGHETISVTAARAGLADGTHNGAITVTSNGGTATVSVSLTVVGGGGSPSGEHICNPKDSTMRLLLIPAGQAILGAGDSPFAEERPAFTASLPAYYLGETEVTNAQYAKFLGAHKPSGTELDSWIDLEAGCGGYCDGRIDKNGETYTVESGWENHPVVCVSWYGAKAYCDWAGLRLPSELEWEKGARGADGREYPWGGSGYRDGWDQGRCRNTYNGYDLGVSTCEVFDYDGTKTGQKDGRSPWGLCNMAGNVFEWTADWFDDDVYSQYAAGDLTPPAGGTDRVVRGGGWIHCSESYYRCAYRGPNDPASRGYQVGFRCARTP